MVSYNSNYEWLGMAVGIAALGLLMSTGGAVTAELNGIAQPQVISNLTLEPNESISPSNPVRVSAFVSDDNLESVDMGVVDINNLLSDDMTLIGAIINKSGINGIYTARWYANSYSIKSGNLKEIVTVLLFDHPKWRDYYTIPGWFKKNSTTDEKVAFLMFNKTTNKLSLISNDNPGFTALTIEKGISIFKVSKFKFLQGWNNSPDRINGSVFTLYDFESPNNPYLISTNVPSGTYRAFIHVVDKNGNNYGAYRDIKVSSVLKGDLNGNGISADAGDLVLMKRASIGEITADSRYDLNCNGQPGDAGDLVLMKRASIGEINLLNYICG